MKKSAFTKTILLTLVFCLSFTCFKSVLGQTNTPLCIDCNSTPICNNSENPTCPTGKGKPACRNVGGICTSVCLNSLSIDPDADSCPSSNLTSSSSGGNVIITGLNPAFTGIWRGKTCCNKIRKNVKLVLCVSNDSLTGSVKIGNQKSTFITLQNTISSNLINVIVNYKNGKTDELNLKLSDNNKKLTGFSKNNFSARKKMKTNQCIPE